MKHLGNELKKLRQSLGLSINAMAREIGVSSTTVSNYEKGILQKQPNNVMTKIIEDFLSGRSRTNNFQVNHCYIILEENHKGGCFRKCERSSVDKPFIFRYENKQGIHHCFREVRGGWSRTYTDTQLMGKIITEFIE